MNEGAVQYRTAFLLNKKVPPIYLISKKHYKKALYLKFKNDFIQ